MSTILFANNATSTLAGGINNTATSAVLAAGTGALFPSPGAGEFFCLTFTDAATGLIREIVHVTGRSTDTITIVRAQEGTTAVAWLAGDLAANLLTAGSMAAMEQTAVIRTQLTTATTFYCNFATGSDSTGDGTSGNPWKTLQFTWDTVHATIDGRGHDLTIEQAGTDTGGLSATGTIPGVATVNITINGALTTAAIGISAGSGARIQIGGSGSISGATFGLSCQEAIVRLAGVSMGVASQAKMIAAEGGQIVIYDDYTDGAGNSASHWEVNESGNIIIFPNATITQNGAAYTQFALVYINGAVKCDTATFTGTPSTGQMYNVSAGGGVYLNGVTLPGTGQTVDTGTYGWVVA